MNLTIRRVGLTILMLFLAVAGQLSYLQLVRADDLESHPGNVRNFLRDLNRPRGAIVSADGAVLAMSVPTDGSGDLRQQRVYPEATASLFAHVVGYQSVVFGNSGVEATYNDELVGRDLGRLLDIQNLSDVFSDRDSRGNVVLTLSLSAQRAAADALAGRRGSVVVLDVTSGAIVAAFSNPTYDPNLLATHDIDVARAAFTLLSADDSNPMLARSWREIYPPGSTFKVVTTALALDQGIVTPEEPVFPDLTELDLPLTDRTLANFGGQRCGGTLAVSFRRSCNTTFGQIGLDLGERLAEGMEAFGIDTEAPPTDLLPGVVRSRGPLPGTFQREAPTFALAGIGQGRVAVTPLQMALVAQAVANGGRMMVPHVIDRVETTEGVRVPESRYRPREWRRAMTLETSLTLRDMMVDVVANGTGTRAQIPGVTVAGKTGTAQVEGNPDPHAWFIAFAPAEAPAYAIAVLVEHGDGTGAEATGGRVAAPIAAQVLQSLLVP